MVKSLYSGVAGLKSQQTKMDVIGNNIANVGTYGYKSSRATFKDVYYQTQTAATAATGNIGGTNAKQVGYGNSVSSIDTNTQTSAMSATGYNLDIAIAGEGFLQVMGMDGKIMYTKAGMLDIDAEGNLVDVNGNFILGSAGDVSAPPASEKINISLPFLDPSTAEVTEKINNVVYTITSSNFTNKGNVNFSFSASTSLPVGQKMAVKVSGSSINVTLNSNEYFRNMEEFNSHLNQAITDALGGTKHPAGTFTVTSSDESMFEAPLSPVGEDGKALGLTGAEIVSNNFGYALGDSGYVSNQVGATQTAANVLKNLFSVSAVNSGFQGDTRISASKLDPDGIKDDDEDNPANFSIEFGLEGIRIYVKSNNSVNPVTHNEGAPATYVAEISYDKLSAPGEVILRRADIDKTKYSTEENSAQNAQTTYDTAKASYNQAKSDYDVAEIAYKKAQADVDKAQADVDKAKADVDKAKADRDAVQPTDPNYANLQAALTAAEGVLTTAQNDLTAAQGVLTTAQNDFTTKENDFNAKDTALKDALEALNVANKALDDAIRANIDYSADETDSMVINYPVLTTIKNAMQQLGMDYSKIDQIQEYRNNPSSNPSTIETFDCGNILKLRHSEPTKCLGLGQKSFTLSGGTEGGEQTVANLTGISINSDGIIVGVHDVYGVCELGRVDLATFANPAGLTKVGSTYFEQSLNSGEPIIVNAGTEGTGEIMASTLEASNVDLSSEFSDMIMTQRGFQASSRVITVSDTMLEELINLKR